MNTKTRRAGAMASSVAAVALVVGGAWGVGAALAQPEPEPTSVVEPANFERPASDFTDTRPDVTPTPTTEPVAEQPAPDPQPGPEPVAEQPAPDPQPGPEPVAEQPAPDPQPAPAPYVPVKCPAGTVPGGIADNGDEVLCQTPCSEWVDNDGDGNAETCARP